MNRSLIWKRRLGKIHSWFSLRDRSRDVILIYHSVGGGPWSTSKEWFKQQMEWIAQYTEVVSLDDLLNVSQPKMASKIRVALTFDDGYRTLHDVVAPLLSQYGFPATLYLNTGEIREDEHQSSSTGQGHYPAEEFMLWSEVEDLLRQQWTIGSHGRRHLDLTVQPATVIAEQLTGSKREIATRLGQECRHFSYTWGRHNSLVRKLVAEAGYKSAVAGHHAALAKTDDPLMLPRLDVRKEYKLEDFAALVCGDWDYLRYYQQARSILR